MRFGMGEVFQFSSPYKWRCSKRFYRLFVYCSWLLLTRDNSTGFTIVWGKVNGTISQKPSANFARSLNVVHSAVISKGSYLGEAYATNINWISNSAISVAGYRLGNGSVNYAVFGFS